MRKFLGALLGLLLGASAQAQTTTQFPTYVGGLTLATTPLTGTEQLYVLQNGQSRRTPSNSLLGLLPAGVPQNKLNTITTSYTIQTTDCGNTVQAGTGSTGFFTVTLPAVTGFASTCVVTIKNSDTGRGKLLAGFPNDLNSILWPLQSVQIGIVASTWQTLYNPGRWRLVSQPIFNIDPVNGNDVNDGLATGVNNAIQTLTRFNAVVTNQLDTNQQIVTALFAAGSSVSNLNLLATITGGGTINLHGNGSTVTSALSNVAAINIQVGPSQGQFSNVDVAVQGWTVTCSNSGNGLFVGQGYVQLFSNMVFGTCTGGAQVEVDSPLARIILGANYSITGGASWHLLAIGGGLIDWNSGAFTATLTGTPAYTGSFAFSEIGGQLVSFNVWSGAATGQRFVANTGGNIFTNNNGPNFFPGNAVGSYTGGFYDGLTTLQSGAVNGINGSAIFNGLTSGNFTLSASATGVPTMSTPWPVAAGGTGDTGTAWTAFTPTFTCGTATITNNSARSKTLGKTTWIQIEFTITAIGTCGTTLTFTGPNTAQSSGTIPLVDIAVSGQLGMCRMSAGSATVNCFTTSATGVPLSNFVVNEHMVGSGVYENQ